MTGGVAAVQARIAEIRAYVEPAAVAVASTSSATASSASSATSVAGSLTAGTDFAAALAQLTGAAGADLGTVPENALSTTVTGQDLVAAALQTQADRAVRLEHLDHVAALRLRALQPVGAGGSGLAGAGHGGAGADRHAGGLQLLAVDHLLDLERAGRVTQLPLRRGQAARARGRADLDDGIRRGHRQGEALL